MTIKTACSLIRELGLTCSYSSDWKEFTVNYSRNDKRRTAESDYKTNDAEDAVDTARTMAVSGMFYLDMNAI